MPGQVPARLDRRVSRERYFEVQAEKSVRTRPEYAVWELEDFAVRRGRIYGRACDDLVGVAAVLGTLIELKRSRARVNAIGLITRAEEIGFLGALAAARRGEIPRNSLVISLETSRELPGVRMGSGVIIRVGDRTSIFNSGATRFLGEVAERLRKQEPGFSFQRGLMSGGTCEGTAYQEFGFQTTAVCVALGNYHNCGAGNRIRAEYVDLGDACGMVKLLAATTRQMDKYEAWTELLPKRLLKLWRGSHKRLRRTSH
jgi:endoglucanase